MIYKDVPDLQAVALRPARPFAAPLPGSTLGALARTYNRIGGLIDRLAQITGIDTVAVLAVWYVESSGAQFVANRAILRFENHKFYKYWGRANLAEFDRHFQFGGHAGIDGKSHSKHRVRLTGTGPWMQFHGTQQREYEVFDLAARLGGAEAASLSASYGGPQIMGFNHRSCGYADANSMRLAFQADERWQVLGFFDFCNANRLLDLIAAHRWQAFSDAYNGDGATHGALMRDAYALKGRLQTLPNEHG